MFISQFDGGKQGPLAAIQITWHHECCKLLTSSITWEDYWRTPPVISLTSWEDDLRPHGGQATGGRQLFTNHYSNINTVPMIPDTIASNTTTAISKSLTPFSGDLLKLLVMYTSPVSLLPLATLSLLGKNIGFYNFVFKNIHASRNYFPASCAMVSNV